MVNERNKIKRILLKTFIRFSRKMSCINWCDAFITTMCVVDVYARIIGNNGHSKGTREGERKLEKKMDDFC